MNTVLENAPLKDQALLSIRSLSKSIDGKEILKNVHFEVPPGRVIGFLGRNGAGKTTTIKAALGFTDYSGDIEVMGQNPKTSRHRVMESVSFISDVGILPRWLRVDQALEFMAAVHPHFQVEQAKALLADSQIGATAQISSLSKGMVTQLHLALVLALDSQLLVLDEPTLGLDLLYREAFYRQLYERFLNESRSLLISTHQIEEIEFLLSDLVMIDQGRILLNDNIENIAAKYVSIEVARESLTSARAREPIYERANLAGAVMIFEDHPDTDWQSLGQVRQTSLAELFVALVGDASRAGSHH